MNGYPHKFQSACEKGYWSFPLAKKVLGFGALVKWSVCAGRGKLHAACLRLDGFRCVWGTKQLEVEKLFSLANFYTSGQLRLRGWFPNSGEVQFNLNFFNQLLGGTSFLEGKHFLLQNSNFSKRITSIFHITLYQSRIQEENEEVFYWIYQFWGPSSLGTGTRYSIKMSFSAKLCVVAHLSMSVCDVIGGPRHGDGPLRPLWQSLLTIGHVWA